MCVGWEDTKLEINGFLIKYLNCFVSDIVSSLNGETYLVSKIL